MSDRTDTERLDRTDLAYWYPRLPGVPTPKTRIFRVNGKSLLGILDGKRPLEFDHLIRYVRRSAAELGYPCFLRTGYGSGKHEWKDTCYLSGETEIGQHIYNLVEWSMVVDLCGLPVNTWAVRELLPTEPLCTDFNEMPITRERRVFCRNGRIECIHPYWPPEALLHEENRALVETDNQVKSAPTMEMLLAVAKEFGGFWSQDWLFTKRGWFLIDMADGSRSFHWPGCTVAAMDAEEEGG